MTDFARLASLAALVVATWCSLTSGAEAQRSIAYFQANGVALEGEVTLAGYEGYTEATLVDLGASRSPMGRVSFAPVRVRIGASSVSTRLLRALVESARMTVQVLTFDAAGAVEQQVDVEARLTSVRSAWSEREGRTVVELELAFSMLTLTSADGTTYTYSWDGGV